MSQTSRVSFTLCFRDSCRNVAEIFSHSLSKMLALSSAQSRVSQLVYYSGWDHTSINFSMSWTLERNHLRYKTLPLGQKMTPLQLWQTLLAFENSIYQVRRLPITFLQRECDKIADEPGEVRRVFNMVSDNDMSVLSPVMFVSLTERMKIMHQLVSWWKVLTGLSVLLWMFQEITCEL